MERGETEEEAKLAGDEVEAGLDDNTGVKRNLKSSS